MRALHAVRRASSSFGNQPEADTTHSQGQPSPGTAHEEGAEGGPGSGRARRVLVVAVALAGVALVPLSLLLSGPGDRHRPSPARQEADNDALGTGRQESRPGALLPSDHPADGTTGARDEDKGRKKEGGEAGADRGSDGGGATPTATTGASRRDGTDTATDPATDAGNQISALVGLQSGKCLTAGGGAQLTIRTCTGAAAQMWDFRPDGTIRSQGLCMDLATTSKSNGTAIRTATCDGDASQQFQLNAVDDLVARIATKCADVYDAKSTNGTPVILWPCTGTANQTWHRR
ncbi:RICIN domain-containing protein [Streptomyces sp. CO7]